MTSLLLKLSCVAFLAVTVIGCSGDNSDQANSGTPELESADGSNKSVPRKSTPVALDLPSTPIDRALFLGLKKAEIAPVGPCPFLSDETALGTAKRSDKLVRRKVSNEECYWSQNLGFSVSVKVEPLADAKPLRDRAYNMDSPPIFDAQPGPGSNALILKDTVWDEEGRPYAMGFEQDGKLVTIYVTGLSTEPARLIATANEVATKLPTAPTIEAQPGQPETFDVCAVWSEATMTAVAGIPVTAVKQSGTCTWKAGDTSISLGVFSSRDFPFDSLIADRGAREIPDLGTRATVFHRNRNPASVLDVTLGDQRMINIAVSDTVPSSEEVALALAKNVISRF